MSLSSTPYPTIEATTPLGIAIADYFGALAPVFANGRNGTFEVIVFGGCAFHVYTMAPGSIDIDAEIASHGHARRDEIVALLNSTQFQFNDDGGIKRTLELDHGFNTTLGPLHEDYIDRVVRLSTPSAIPNIEVYIAGALDLAISKLGRFSERDRLDILTLLALPHANVDDFERLATEALGYYVGNIDQVRGNLKIVLKVLN